MAKTLRHPFGIGDQCKQIRRRIHLRQHFGDAFTASLSDEPVMDHSNSHLDREAPTPVAADKIMSMHYCSGLASRGCPVRVAAMSGFCKSHPVRRVMDNRKRTILVIP